MNIIIASNNNGKIKEYKKILEPLGYNVQSQSESGVNINVDETGTTFEENAKLKAEAIYKLRPDCEVISDDSGLCVDYLDGAPGIYSARYKGLETDEEHRVQLLKDLESVPDSQRNAHFVCCICYINKSGEAKFAKGIWPGKIATEERGNNGFGYDPIFIPDGENKTSAEMTPEEKNSKSHRARAIKELLKLI